jgi:hypothetical protein
VIRERIGRALSHAYPHEVLADRGREMLGTLLDASEHSAAAFARECGLLWLAAMRERARITARSPALAGIIGGVLAWMVLMISALSIPWR